MKCLCCKAFTSSGVGGVSEQVQSWVIQHQSLDDSNFFSIIHGVLCKIGNKQVYYIFPFKVGQ